MNAEQYRAASVVRTHPALEDQNSVPNAILKWFTISVSPTRGSVTLFWPSYVLMDTHTQLRYRIG